MSAPQGNQFWKQRSKHGRDNLFATPELLADAAEEYFQWCKDNPLVKYEQGRGNKPVKDEVSGEYVWPDNLVAIPTARPFTLNALRLYIDCSPQYFTNFKHGLRAKLKDPEIIEGKTVHEFSEAERQKAEDFLKVITRIEEIIYTQKFEGAVVGAYNANIIARDLGLREGIDQQVTGNIHLSKEPTTFE